MATKTVRLRAGILASVAATMVLLNAQANAHAKVASTKPTASSTVSSPQVIQVRFNEAIEARLSSLRLTASDGSTVPVKSMNDAKDPATLSIMPKTALKPGLYTATWSAVTDDGHKTHGVFSFTVR